MNTVIKDRVGEKYISTHKEEFTIVAYEGANNITVQFEDGTVVEEVRFGSIKKGTVKNPNRRSFNGVGYLGQGKYKLANDSKLSDVWIKMLGRCYSENYQQRQPTYKDVTVCEEWHNFQNFAEWWYNHYNSDTMQGWQIDKDIICKDCKIYSPETCCLVPREINAILTLRQNHRGVTPLGVQKRDNSRYIARMNIDGKRVEIGRFDTPEEAFECFRKAKVEKIIQVADKYKPLLEEKVYQALINFNFNIND